MKETIITAGPSLQHAIDLLKESSLPYDDIDPSKSRIIGYHNDEGTLVATGGLEFYGPYALLRSIAVHEAYRGKLYGQQIVKTLIDHAKTRSIKQVYLLTETAHKYFLKLGFKDVTRENVPVEIKQSTEFVSVCPVSAACMVYNLSSSD
jgi:amino-acid N-acetyltransferase